MWVGLSEQRTLGLKTQSQKVKQDRIAQGPPAGFRNSLSMCLHLRGGETFGYRLQFVCPLHLLAGDIYSYSKGQNPQELPLLFLRGAHIYTGD